MRLPLLPIVAAASLSVLACGHMDTRSTRTGTPLTAEKSFAAGGRIEMQLDGGDYEIRPFPLPTSAVDRQDMKVRLRDAVKSSRHSDDPAFARRIQQATRPVLAA